MNFKNIRVDYKKLEINFKDLDSHPLDLFLKWFTDILAINKEANACVLSTVTHDNKPSSRMLVRKVLCFLLIIKVINQLILKIIIM